MIAEKIRQAYRSAEISTKIAVTYAACFLVLLLVLNAVMYIGVSRAFYDPAERTIIFSMQKVRELLENLEIDYSAVNPDNIREPLVTGVVLRAVDDDGEVFVDTDKKYPSAEKVDAGILSDPPIFASDDMEVAEVGSALIYRAKMDYIYGGEHVTLYFYRTITSQKAALDNLETLLLALDALGIFLAAAAGHFVSSRVLKPIKTMTTHAQNIAFGKMGGRLEIPPSDDELSALAKTFNEMLDRLQGGINQQQKFVLDASHELINPATAIAGCVELLKRYGAMDRQSLNENLDIIFEEVQNIDNILQNMLFIARTDQNRQKLHREKLELANIVEYAVDTMRVLAPEHRLELLRNDDATIFGDDIMIRQLIRIFLENAVRYTPAGGRITVSSVNSGGKIQLSISDTGIGIAPENLGKIFDRFFKGGGSGSGLGLAIAKWISDRHEIKIDVASELGAGSTFTLTFPAA